VNHYQHERILTKLRNAAGGSLSGTKVALWGLTFKANTNDLRDSPAFAILHCLLEEGAAVCAYDPVANEAAASQLPALEVVPDPYQAFAGASVLALLTEWDEFRWLDFARVAGAMVSPRAVVDARNLLDPAAMRRRGFFYQGVGC
jgi:UDPglucose 6-dehydrogenase